MKVLVTGGAGFLGSHLCEKLVHLGHSVVCMDNLLTGSLENVEALSRHRRFQFVKADVTLPIRLSGKLDAVLHFASCASPVDYLRYPIQTLKAGALGTYQTLGLAKVKGAKFLIASTSEVYGDPQVHPQRENYWGHVNPVGPRGVYDEAKRFAEAMTMAYHRAHQVNTRIARIFNTFGPRMRSYDGRAIPTFIAQALKGESVTIHGDGSQTRSFCYVTDLIDGFIRLLKSDWHYPVNLGNPQEVTVKQVAQRIIALTGSRSRIVYRSRPVDDPARRKPNIALARKKLGWKPQVSLSQGLNKTIEWFSKNR